MKLVNLKELIKYHPYHISTFAGFANVTTDLLEAAIEGEEELTSAELTKITYYANVPANILMFPKLITLRRNKYKHRQMVGELEEKLNKIYDAAKKGDEDAVRYMNYQRTHLMQMLLDFQNNSTVGYCRYLGIKEEVDQTLSFIRHKQIKPRGREGRTA